jgi:hypothetical protein
VICAERDSPGPSGSHIARTGFLFDRFSAMSNLVGKD